MMLLLLIVMFIIMILPEFQEKKKFYILFALMMIVNIISFGFGTDYLSYQYLYNAFKSIDTVATQNIEPGFRTLLAFFKSVNVNYYIFAILIRSVILGLIAKWIYDSSNNYVLSMIVYFSLFFSVWGMSALRQGLVLSIGSYILFNKRINIGTSKKILIVFLISTFHLSGLIYIPILILQKFNWNKKYHLILLGVSLCFSFIPLSNIIPYFEFLPGVSKVANYLDGGFGFFDTSSIMRLFFFFIVFIKYDFITKESYDKKVVDSFLFGTSIYFLLKFSEITAGRMNIYTFILIVLIVPNLIPLYQTKTKFLPKIAVSLICVFLFTKDLISYKSQVNYQGDINIFSIPTIFNYKYSDFDNIYSYIEYRKESSDEYISNLQKSFVKQEVAYSEDLKYYAIKNKDNKYGIIDSNGNWFMKPSQNHEIVVYDGVYSLPKKNGIYWELKFYDMKGIEEDQEILKNKVNEFLSTQEVKDFKQTSLNIDVNSIVDMNLYVPVVEHITNQIIVNIKDEDLEYNVIYFQYYSHHLYIYLDKDLKPVSNMVFSQNSLFSNGFMKVQTMTGYVIFNENFEIIWAEHVH